MDDSRSLYLGAGNDLRIYHDGSDSYIKDQGTGNLVIQASDIYFGDDSGNHRIRMYGSGRVNFTQTNAEIYFTNGITGASASNSDIRYNTTSGQIYYQTSSKRYKKDITDLEIDTTKIYELDTVSFTDKTTEDRCFGLIAEEVDKVIPELVNKRVIEGFGDEPVPDTISYSMLSVLLLKELQSTKIKLDDALARIKTLEDA
jgi:hypothetical protein